MSLLQLKEKKERSVKLGELEGREAKVKRPRAEEFSQS